MTEVELDHFTRKMYPFLLEQWCGFPFEFTDKERTKERCFLNLKRPNVMTHNVIYSASGCTGLPILASSLFSIFFFNNQVEVNQLQRAGGKLHVEPFSSSGNPPTFSALGALGRLKKQQYYCTIILLYYNFLQ